MEELTRQNELANVSKSACEAKLSQLQRRVEEVTPAAARVWRRSVVRQLANVVEGFMDFTLD